MRTKTFLLFVFLLTGMAFSQQNETSKPISFGEVLSILDIGRLSTLKMTLKDYGYIPDWENRDTYRKGMHRFQMFRKSKTDDFFTFLELNLTTEREESLKADALAAGFKIVKEDTENIEMSNNIFVINLKKGQQIEITRK
ncbi:MAG: hypothetical protein LCH52_10210 [Bacteroidetes bacterium]|nr:hypothetical protein [Bacteroidota bacterium]